MDRKTPARSLTASAIAILAAGSLALPAQAQQEDPAASSRPARLDTVVVTANKRVQNLQDVPAAITVLNDAALQRANVRDIDDLPALAPALTVTYSNQPGNYSINMRGIGTYSLGIGVEADVAVIIDDIPMGIQAGAFKDLADVYRVEVLKGPQSTLFGKSSIAGALNITTRPIGGPVKTTASVLATNDGEWRAATSVSGAVSDTFRLRLAASKTSYDGNVDNLTTGHKINGSKGRSLGGKVEWRPLDELTVTVSPHYSETEKFCCVSPFTSMSAGALYQNVASLPASTLLAGIALAPDNVAVRNDFPTGGVFRNGGAGLKVEYQFGPGSPLAGHALASITSWDDYHMDDYNDGDGTDANVLPYLKDNAGLQGGLYQAGFFNTRSRTQELRLTSPDSGALRYVAGLWYGDNALERQLRRAPATTFANFYNARARNTSYAVFGQVAWAFRPATSVIAGLRLNREVTGYDFRRYAAPPAAAVITERLSQTDTHRDVTGRLGLEHHVDQDTMVYAVFSTGHKGVAYDLTSSFNAALAKLQPVPAETARNIEVGVKAVLLDRRAMLNLSLFRTRFKGFQQSAGFIDPDGIFRTTLHSIGALQTSGVELDGSFKAGKRWLLNGSLAYTEAVVVEFENGPCYSVYAANGLAVVPGPGCAVNPKYNNTAVQNLAGKTLPNAPRFKVNLGGQYDLPLAAVPFDAWFTGAWRWQSATQFSLNQDPNTIQGGYGIANIGFGIRARDDRYRLGVFVNNLFDKSYAVGLGHAVGTAAWNASAPNPPAQVETSTWIPARDYRRYVGVRLDATF